MQLSARHEIAVPQEFAFARCTDIARLTDVAATRGWRLAPEHPGQALAEGAIWHLVGESDTHEGATIAVTLADCEPPRGLGVTFAYRGFDVLLALEFAPLAPERSRLTADLELTPRTTKARLAHAAMRLARGRLREGLKKRLRQAGAAWQTEWRLEGNGPMQRGRSRPGRRPGS